jgi:hypothetical protein
MTAVGFVVAVLLLVVMAVAEVRRVAVTEVGAARSRRLLRTELLLMLACAVLVLPRAIGLLT